MDPQAVTVGARVGRRMQPVLLLAMSRSTDPVAFAGGLFANIAGTIAGVIQPGSAAELLRQIVANLEQRPDAGRLALPPGVREAFAQAAANEDPPIAEVLGAVNNEQVEAMRRVLAVVSAKAGIESDQLVELLDSALRDIRAGVPPRPPL